MRNYEREREAFLKSHPEDRRLLLHGCCAPCATAVVERLAGEGLSPVLYFYNPNIDGDKEYALRLSELRRFLASAYPAARLIAEPYRAEDFYAAAKGYETEPEGGARCERCFRLRIRASAEKARAEGIGLVGTTLTVSPLKNAETVNRIGAEEAARAGVRWLPADFKKKDGYRRSVALSREYGLYRQNFCGCAYSKIRDPETHAKDLQTRMNETPGMPER